MMKESHPKETMMTKMAKEKGNALNVKIKIISSENAQNYQETTIKERTSEDHGVIAMKKKKKRLRMKNVLWLKHPMRECPKLSRNYYQGAYVGGSWSDSDEEKEEKTKDEKCLMAKASNEVNANALNRSIGFDIPVRGLNPCDHLVQQTFCTYKLVPVTRST
uniref:Zf-CCHC domain-containing protein/DUF4219 domain-containing protein/UBN2 domain-containing protein n=1 Tax=Tanacetum cinerariifolium TaxID=118510 RepID=A0A699HZZ0_TANCI|nr:zf-CCHC domain-containing protein/DUF4219 domain-containing protein/UBN2 domain-containing protein [Tanacetum cinerariifolium]